MVKIGERGKKDHRSWVPKEGSGRSTGHSWVPSTEHGAHAGKGTSHGHSWVPHPKHGAADHAGRTKQRHGKRGGGRS